MAYKKGVILEVGDGWAIIMLPGGEYKKIRTNEHLLVGQLYHYKNNITLKFAGAAAVLLIMVIASLDFFTVTAWAHISPGIDLGLNRWDRVVSIEKSDPAAHINTQDLDLKGKNINQAINVIVKEQVSQSDLEGTVQEELSVSVSLKDKKDNKRKEKLLTQLEGSLKDSIADNKDKSRTKIIRKDNKLKVLAVPVTADKANNSSNVMKENKNNEKPQKEQQLLQEKIKRPSKAVPSDNNSEQIPGQIKKEKSQPNDNNKLKKVKDKKDRGNSGNESKEKAPKPKKSKESSAPQQN